MTGRIGIRLAAIVIAAMTLTGCETVGGMFKSKEVSLEKQSARQIYDSAEALLKDGQAEAAAKRFNDVERLYPFSQLAKRAMIMAAFAYYEANQRQREQPQQESA